MKEVDILQAIQWVADSWKEVTVETIQNCFGKCGISEKTIESEEEEIDEEFTALFGELTKDFEDDITAEEYIDFDVSICSASPAINFEMVDWKIRSVQECVDNYIKNANKGEEETSIVLTSDEEDDAEEIEIKEEAMSKHWR